MFDVGILKALENGGSLILFAVMVWYFLQFSMQSYKVLGEEMKSAMAEMNKRFNEEITSSRKDFQAQISHMTDQVAEMTRETSAAIRGLEAAVRDLQQKIRS